MHCSVPYCTSDWRYKEKYKAQSGSFLQIAKKERLDCCASSGWRRKFSGMPQVDCWWITVTVPQLNKLWLFSNCQRIAVQHQLICHGNCKCMGLYAVDDIPSTTLFFTAGCYVELSGRFGCWMVTSVTARPWNPLVRGGMCHVYTKQNIHICS